MNITGPLAILVAIATTGCTGSSAPGDPTPEPTHYGALILPAPYSQIRAVLHAPEDLAFSDFAVSGFLDQATRATGKAVHIENGEALPDWAKTARRWSPEDLTRLANELPPHGLRVGEYGRGNEAVIGIYLLHGTYENENLGAETENRIFVMDDDGEPARNAPYTGERAQRRTLVHELGHALGLVNCGIPMVRAREHPESPCHSTNNASAMGIQRVITPTGLLDDTWEAWQFDADDLADIAAYREANS